MASLQASVSSSSLRSTGDVPAERTRGLARKLTCSVLSLVVAGAFILLLIQVILTLISVGEWGDGTKSSMMELEEENLLKLAERKAEFVSEHFGRVRESVLQLRAFAEEAILGGEETMVIDSYLASFSGLEQSEDSFEHSSWFIPGLAVAEVPEAGGSLDGLLNRSSLMDVPFRAMQRQHRLVYIAALDNPYPAEGVVSQINMQGFAAFNMTSYLDYGLINNNCDPRFAAGSTVETYDPRCRLWYQDAVEAGNTGVIITNPYKDANTEDLILTAAAPVFNSNDGTILGVVGLDIDTEVIESFVKDLTVIGDEGYAYVLAPGGEGQVAFNQYLLDYSEEEEGAFKALIAGISNGTECEGLANYSMNGDTWILAWKHENVSGAGTSGSDDCGDGSFIAVVTVSKAVLSKAFSETASEISRVVALASLVMALVLLVIGCAMGFIACFVAGGIVGPVNQLIEVVHALNKLDFSRQVCAPGTWMVNETSSPEVEELMKAFEAMTAVVKFANTTLANGDISSAKLIYVEALKTFAKLGNDRGVAIVNNNLGNVHTLLAAKHATQAAAIEGNNPEAQELAQKAHSRYYADAIRNYKFAIEDAEMRCAAIYQQGGHGSSLHPTHDGAETKQEELTPSYMSVQRSPPNHVSEVEAGSLAVTDVEIADDDNASEAALYRQLANRKFNLALCLASKSNSAVSSGGQPDVNAIDQARSLMKECIQLISSTPSSLSSFSSTLSSSWAGRSSKNSNTENDLLRFEFLLKLSTFEREQEGRSREAKEALDIAEGVISSYDSVGRSGGSAVGAAAGRAAPLETPVQILQQRLLEARAAHCVAGGYPEEAIDHYTQAIIGKGPKMDPDVARSSLMGLRKLVSSGGNNYGRLFSSELLVALSLPPGAGKDPEALVSAIDVALAKVEEVGRTALRAPQGPQYEKILDLCFVMDCTGSMQRWIDQAKNKLMDIIVKTKRDHGHIRMRVAFVGYRDFGDRVQYERFDFHTEEEVPKLLAKLQTIEAYGGQDVPEDVAGGLKLATGLKWRGEIRLCILIADAPPHGRVYHHRGMEDRYPNGCPRGHDPSKLLYELQYEIRADFYFVRITQYTDKMISALHNNVLAMWEQSARKPRSAEQETKKREIVVHDLGSNENRFKEAVVQSLRFSIYHMESRLVRCTRSKEAYRRIFFPWVLLWCNPEWLVTMICLRLRCYLPSFPGALVCVHVVQL
ncbi:unnamed protein product [Pylaiella littoralis]